MNLMLVAVSLNDQALSQPVTSVIDSGVGAIGRAADNPLVARASARHELRTGVTKIQHSNNLSPTAREARLWHLHLRSHQSSRDKAQDDVHTLFGKAFLAACEQRINRRNSKAAPR